MPQTSEQTYLQHISHQIHPSFPCVFLASWKQKECWPGTQGILCEECLPLEETKAGVWARRGLQDLGSLSESGEVGRTSQQRRLK